MIIALDRKRFYPIKRRLITALLLGPLTKRQLAPMLSTTHRSIENAVSDARKNGDVHIVSTQPIRHRQHYWIAYWALTEQGLKSAKKMIESVPSKPNNSNL